MWTFEAEDSQPIVIPEGRRLRTLPRAQTQVRAPLRQITPWERTTTPRSKAPQTSRARGKNPVRVVYL